MGNGKWEMDYLLSKEVRSKVRGILAIVARILWEMSIQTLVYLGISSPTRPENQALYSAEVFPHAPHTRLTSHISNGLSTMRPGTTASEEGAIIRGLAIVLATETVANVEESRLIDKKQDGSHTLIVNP